MHKSYVHQNRPHTVRALFNKFKNPIIHILIIHIYRFEMLTSDLLLISFLHIFSFCWPEWSYQIQLNHWQNLLQELDLIYNIYYFINRSANRFQSFYCKNIIIISNHKQKLILKSQSSQLNFTEAVCENLGNGTYEAEQTRVQESGRPFFPNQTLINCLAESRNQTTTFFQSKLC